jgi:hypothetical protein
LFRISSYRARSTGRGGTRAGLLRGTFGVAAATLLVLAVVAACGGSKDKPKGMILGTRASSPNASPNVSRATFTPTIEGATPPREQTKEVLIQAATQTAAAGGPVSPTTQSNVPTTPTATLAPNEIRPPSAQMSTASGIADGAVGSYNYGDPSKYTGADITVPYVQLPDSGGQLPSGATLTISVSGSLYPVESGDMEIYDYEHNTAVPQDASGKVIGTTLAFFRQTDPKQTQTVNGANLTFTPEVSPGRYIVSVKVHWLAPDTLPQFKGVLYTQYVFNLEVL